MSSSGAWPTPQVRKLRPRAALRPAHAPTPTVRGRLVGVYKCEMAVLVPGEWASGCWTLGLGSTPGATAGLGASAQIQLEIWGGQWQCWRLGMGRCPGVPQGSEWAWPRTP